jgi:single-stranded-DNA-specific exonuclease
VGESREREWKLRSELSLSDSAVREKLATLEKETGLSPITLRVCLMRGLDSAEAIREFLAPRVELLVDPFRIRDMDLAIDRLAKARAAGERIRVFGDYDVDGTTGAALLSWIFREFGYTFEARQPDRFKDGYGLNVGAVEEAHAAGATVMVTVDCGITSFDAANRAKELGIDLIVVDHHQIDPVKGLPVGVAIIDPQRADCESGLKQLCGCGLAFYLARALRARGKQEGWWPEGKEPNLKQHLDLVVMATSADMVPLTGDNHILARHGLEVLKNTRKPGVKALLEVSGAGGKTMSPGHLGFVIGPRINASGRMGSASHALELLTTTDPLRAAQLAQDLEKMNAERASVQNRIWDEVRVKVEKGLAEGKYRHGIAVADPGWHEGVVGIVASRVTETFRKPAAVIAFREDGIGKGSVRSYAGKDVLSALRASSATLKGFGGHKHAAGLTVDPAKFDEFAQAFDDALGQIAEDKAYGPLLIEGNCSIADLDLRTLQELESLGPFGPGNPEPVFCVRASVKQKSVLKGRHYKMHLGELEDAAASSSAMAPGASPMIEAIWFHAAEREEFSSDSSWEEGSEWACVPELNRFRGRMTPTLRVRDCRRIPTSS